MKTSIYGQWHRKHHKRFDKCMPRIYQCGYPRCGLKYAMEWARNRHRRVKHGFK